MLCIAWVDPEGSSLSFLSSGAALQVSVGTVVAAVAGSPLSLQQLVHPLDDALQGLVHVQPHLLPLFLMPVMVQRTAAAASTPRGQQSVLVVAENDLLRVGRGR